MKNPTSKLSLETQKILQQHKKTYEEKLLDLKQEHTLKIQRMKEKIRVFQSLIKEKQ